MSPHNVLTPTNAHAIIGLLLIEFLVRMGGIMFETHCMILAKKQSNTVLDLICTNQYLVREVAGLVSFEIALGARGSI